jgi:hypothetical protein
MTVPNRKDRLAAEAEVEREREYPPAWDRDEEPRLFGTVVDDKTVETKYGTRRLVQIQRDDGSVTDVWVTPARLVAEWEMAAPEIGDYVLISFHGLIDVGKGNPMVDIRVRVDRDQAKLDEQSSEIDF